MIDLNTPIAELTAKQLLELISTNNSHPTTQKESRQFVYGIAGLAKIANCSLPTAQKLKNSGLIPFSQAGRKIIFEVDEVLFAIKKSKK